MDGLICALLIRDVGCARWPINVVIRLDLRLIDHIVTIIQLNPVMHRLHHLLLLLLVDLGHLLLLLLLGVCLIITAILSSIHQSTLSFIDPFLESINTEKLEDVMRSLVLDDALRRELVLRPLRVPDEADGRAAASVATAAAAAGAAKMRRKRRR